jgi:hypothetical protein
MAPVLNASTMPAVQVGAAAAHKSGLVHRDLKAGEIFSLKKQLPDGGVGAE